MQIGVDRVGAVISDPATGLTLSPVQRMQNLLEEIVLADQVGLDVFGIGEHHRSEFVDSAPVVILGAAATRTKNIRLTSAVTVLSAADPVRVFQEFATLDLISHGRAEIVAGRGSSVEAYPLFGFDLDDYDSLFSEKLDLLLNIRENTRVRWTGKHRAALTGQAVYPRPLQNPLPIWIGVGGTPASFVRAGTLGLPLMACHHRRRTKTTSAPCRSLPRGWASRRSLRRETHRGHSRHRLPRRHNAQGFAGQRDGAGDGSSDTGAQDRGRLP
jgi:alkanesulfonate monooxygenase SsuD/methylene tetrahydromethanopterin reductase-like flavin-dependent oxidoreductase (luciferase family)